MGIYIYRFIRLVAKDSCLVIIQTNEHLKVYLDQINTLGSGIEADRPKKQILISRIGEDCVFALDETRRLLAILTCHSVSYQNAAGLLAPHVCPGLNQHLCLYLRRGGKGI